MNFIKPVLAQITNPIIDPAITTQMQSNPQAFTSNLVQTIISLLMLVAVIFFLWHFLTGGFEFISSEGDPEKAKKARKKLTYAFMGLFIVFSIFAILKLIGTIFGVTGLDTLQLTIPSLK
jgi:succinate dehydrogenase hydrophobic anchor subunit